MEDALRYAREVRGDRQTRPDVSAVLIYNVPRKYLTPKSDKNVIFEFDGNVESQRREEYKATVRYFRHVQKCGFLNDRQPRHLFPLIRIRIIFLIYLFDLYITNILRLLVCEILVFIQMT